MVWKSIFLYKTSYDWKSIVAKTTSGYFYSM